jgi:hypothetical protein
MDERETKLNETITRKYVDLKTALNLLGEAQTRTRHARLMWAVSRNAVDAEELNAAKANEAYRLREVDRYDTAYVALKWPIGKLEMPKQVIFDVDNWIDSGTY